MITEQLREDFKKQAYMAYKSRLNIIAEVYWLFYRLFNRLFYRLFCRLSIDYSIDYSLDYFID